MEASKNSEVSYRRPWVSPTCEVLDVATTAGAGNAGEDCAGLRGVSVGLCSS